jgi:D-alanyl-lipoteichoic acid acyltransferase DltB (MBOAT superfamily)
MLFNSFDFLLFLPIVFVLYWFVVKPLKWQNLLVVVASYIFYGWWNKTFLLLIAFTSLCSYLSGILIERVDNVNKRKNWGGSKFVVATNIILNLGILGIYKYFDFFAESIAAALNAIGLHVDPITLNLVLPIGISFYTFQALSYTIDVYRGKIEPTHDIVAFFAYISFFPQLVAGPIERATNLLPQFLSKRTFDLRLALDGSKLIIWGFFKKLVIADTAGEFTQRFFAAPSDYSTLQLWLGALLFTFQIYGDFSGYSDIAIGVARLFGIRLKKNFNLPYLSRNIAEFWKRWHISLNTWFVDYIYIPLGGSRQGKSKTIRNTSIIFLISGLWHGADWTFILWGAYHALLFIPLLLTDSTKKFGEYNRNEPIKWRWLPNIALTFTLAMVGWVIFASDNISIAGEYLKGMFIPHTTTISAFSITSINRWCIALLFLIYMEFKNRGEDTILQFSSRRPIFNKVGYVFVAVIALLFYQQSQEFIYFQF